MLIRQSKGFIVSTTAAPADHHVYVVSRGHGYRFALTGETKETVTSDGWVFERFVPREDNHGTNDASSPGRLVVNLDWLRRVTPLGVVPSLCQSV